MGAQFDRWIDTLTEDVIQDEYGYEPGEFTVYPDQWQPDYLAGLSPQQAFRKALDAFSEARREEERLRADNWVRIQAEDAKHRTNRP